MSDTFTDTFHVYWALVAYRRTGKHNNLLDMKTLHQQILIWFAVLWSAMQTGHPMTCYD